MIYLVIYLAIGVATSLLIPIRLARARAGLSDVPPDKIAAMTPADRKQWDYFVSTARLNPKPWMLALVGLVWPLQIIGIVWAHIFGNRINKRAAAAAKFRSPCPGCSRNLVGLEGTDAVEDRDTNRVRFVCGMCSTISDWRFSETGSTFLGSMGVARSLDVKR